MKKILAAVFAILLFSALCPKTFAQDSLQQPNVVYLRGRVDQIVKQENIDTQAGKVLTQTVEVILEQGPDKGKDVTLTHGLDTKISKSGILKKGDEIIVSKSTSPQGKVTYDFNDYYRLNTVFILLIVFFIAVVLVAGLKGIGSIAGMSVSLGVILLYIIPNILKGENPLEITLAGSVVIIFVSTYLAHGISKKTTIALFSTLISLGLAAFFSILAVNFAKIAGVGNEDFYTLQIGPTNVINIQGLFLSAILISTLGALNDITTTQSATIEELKKTNPKLTAEELFDKGLKVGREHIASLVNTLILAYVGSSFAVFIFFILNPAKVPYFVILNSELVTDEVIRIIAGSLGLLFSVPIVTFLASLFYGKLED